MAVGITRQYLARIEQASAQDVPAVLLAKLFAVIGMRLSARAYPAGLPLRDASHVALLRRLQGALPDGVRMRTEVPVGDGDGRAWDARLQLTGGPAFVEAETRIRDVQALGRRIALKRLSAPSAPVVLLVADTKLNRATMRAARSLLHEAFPASTRSLLRDLRQGRCPAESGIVFL